MEYINLAPLLCAQFKFINIIYNGSKYSINGEHKIYDSFNNSNDKYICVNYDFSCDDGDINTYSFIIELENKTIISGNFDETTVEPFKSLFYNIISNSKK